MLARPASIRPIRAILKVSTLSIGQFPSIPFSLPCRYVQSATAAASARDEAQSRGYALLWWPRKPPVHRPGMHLARFRLVIEAVCSRVRRRAIPLWTPSGTEAGASVGRSISQCPGFVAGKWQWTDGQSTTGWHAHRSIYLYPSGG